MNLSRSVRIVASALRAIDYQGYFTIPQAQGIETAEGARALWARCASFFRSEERAL